MNFFEAVKIHLRLGLLIIFAVTTIAWFHALTSTPIFESTSRLLIEVKDLGLGQEFTNPYSPFSTVSDPIQTQIQILNSATILDRVIRQFNMRYKSGPNQGRYLSYLTLAGGLSVEAAKQSDIVELQYTDPSPTNAKSILQAIVDNYIETTVELKTSDTSSTIRFLKKERNKAERELLDASKRLKEFEQSSKTVNFESNQELVKSSYALKELRLTVETEHVKAKSAAAEISKQLMTDFDNAILNSTISQDPFLQALRTDLYQKETQLVKIQTKVKTGHYQLEEIKEQIEGDKRLIKERIKELVGKEVNPESFPYSNDPLRTELTRTLLQTKVVELAAEQQLTVIDDALRDLLKKVDKLPGEKFIYSQLLRQTEIAQKRLEEIEAKLIEARMKGVVSSHVANIRVIDPPSLSESPKFPNIPNTLLASFIFGVFLALVVIYLVEYFDDIIKGVDTLPKEMKCPFLGSLPVVHTGDLPTVYQEPRSAYTEAIHALRTNLSFLSLSGDKKLLLVTSPGSGEGKSTTSVNLAMAYAQSGKRILLIDCDIRNPSIHKYLARPKDSVGISNTLINEIDFYDVVQKSILGVVGFDLLPGGDVPPNPVQLLESERMKELIETAQHIYDLVVIDTPPIGLFSDALLLSRYADVIALVTRHSVTSRKELMSCLDLLDKSGIKTTGVILNAVPSSSHAYGYGYGYYGYGEDQTERYAHEKSAA